MEDVQTLLKEYYLRDKIEKSSEEIEELLKLVTCDQYWTIFNNLQYDNDAVRDFFDSLEAESEDKSKYLKFGIACLICFVQCNFTGPDLPEDFVKYLEREHLTGEHIILKLSANNPDDVNPNTKYPVLLLVSEMIFNSCVVDRLVNLWWHCRALMVHQMILDELSRDLLATAERIYKVVEYVTLDGKIKAQFNLELAQLYLKFHHITKVKELITTTTSILGCSCNLKGKLGKRTKHQEKEVALLTVEIKLEEREGISREEIPDLPIPKNIELDDDVRLDEVEFKDQIKLMKLTNLEQKLFLTTFDHLLIATPNDGLKYEELLPVIEVIARQNSKFSPRYCNLIARAQIESKETRTLTRSLKQCEELIDCFHKKEPPVMSRVEDFFSVNFPPLWKIEALYADILLQMGLVKNSVEIYLKIKQWEELIVCYKILEERNKVVEIVKEQLEKKPTVKLLCLLGDATDDVVCYEEAWNMSNKRSFRAQRHWGQFYYGKKEYADAIPHFERSLSINPLQPVIWFRLGYAALQVENWQTAATAYRRYTTLEPDNFEAWYNLAQAYIQLNNQRSAYQMLVEAMRCNFHNWRVWEEFMIVSSELGLANDVIRAYHQLMDMRHKYLKHDVLWVLVEIVKDQNDSSVNNNNNNLLQKTRELLGRVTAAHPNNAYIWELYADVAPDLTKKVERLQKAYRGYAQIGWDKELKLTLQVLNICNKLADCILEDEIGPESPVFVSNKWNIASTVNAIQKKDFYETKELLLELVKKFNRILEKFGSNKVT